ncbi:MAG: hypothetical protein P8181_17725, partial [bacterium]
FMTRNCIFFCITIAVVALLPVMIPAIPTGTGRLISVIPVAGDCVSGPTGGTVQAWDIERGATYTLTISNVFDCANGGTDPTINVRVNSSTVGYEYTDLVAYYVSPGVYQFDFTVPLGAVCTFPLFYCTTPGEWLTSGLRVIRDDGVDFQSHLRASWFDENCANPDPIIGPECGTIPVEESSWGAVKALYQ